MSASNVSRREFLNYLLLGSGAMMGIGTVTGMLWYASTSVRYQPGTPKSLVRVETIQPTTIQFVREASAYLINLETGLIALSRICPFLNTPVTCVQINNRFECPMCGSKYELNGRLISGEFRPAI